MIKICVVGAHGRMGGLVIKEIGRDETCELSGAIGRGDDLAADAAGADAIIDFSPAGGAIARIEEYRAIKKPLIVAGTGFSESEAAAVDSLGADMPLIRAANTSVGVNLILRLVREAAAALSGFDIGITEIHHKRKKDAPSGTALLLGRACGCTQIQSLRGGSASGIHTVHFLGDGESVEISHNAATPEIFAKGAVAAAKWLAGKPNGIYSMADVLGI
ncbi:MAG: 4-hydroxy-tetrahydrodipicolinate reductase [Rickettsiales bacterium]|jgi:4-hydroxy-tetrahydrodipicolinate reductase|nr:4-hydroxy-tetrahydrodipicolinate reductase [Rickettsiales bacterium]